MLSMEESYAQDQQRRRELHNARQAILTFLDTSGELHTFSKRSLEEAADHLWHDILVIDRRWD